MSSTSPLASTAVAAASAAAVAAAARHSLWLASKAAAPATADAIDGSEAPPSAYGRPSLAVALAALARACQRQKQQQLQQQQQQQLQQQQLLLLQQGHQLFAAAASKAALAEWNLQQQQQLQQPQQQQHRASVPGPLFCCLALHACAAFFALPQMQQLRACSRSADLAAIAHSIHAILGGNPLIALQEASLYAVYQQAPVHLLCAHLTGQCMRLLLPQLGCCSSKHAATALTALLRLLPHLPETAEAQAEPHAAFSEHAIASREAGLPRATGEATCVTAASHRFRSMPSVWSSSRAEPSAAFVFWLIAAALERALLLLRRTRKSMSSSGRISSSSGSRRTLTSVVGAAARTASAAALATSAGSTAAEAAEAALAAAIELLRAPDLKALLLLQRDELKAPDLMVLLHAAAQGRLQHPELLLLPLLICAFAPSLLPYVCTQLMRLLPELLLQHLEFVRPAQLLLLLHSLSRLRVSGAAFSGEAAFTESARVEARKAAGLETSETATGEARETASGEARETASGEARETATGEVHFSDVAVQAAPKVLRFLQSDQCSLRDAAVASTVYSSVSVRGAPGAPYAAAIIAAAAARLPEQLQQQHAMQTHSSLLSRSCARRRLFDLLTLLRVLVEWRVSTPGLWAPPLLRNFAAALAAPAAAGERPPAAALSLQHLVTAAAALVQLQLLQASFRQAAWRDMSAMSTTLLIQHLRAVALETEYSLLDFSEEQHQEQQHGSSGKVAAAILEAEFQKRCLKLQQKAEVAALLWRISNTDGAMRVFRGASVSPTPRKRSTAAPPRARADVFTPAPPCSAAAVRHAVWELPSPTGKAGAALKGKQAAPKLLVLPSASSSRIGAALCALPEQSLLPQDALEELLPCGSSVQSASSRQQQLLLQRHPQQPQQPRRQKTPTGTFAAGAAAAAACISQEPSCSIPPQPKLLRQETLAASAVTAAADRVARRVVVPEALLLLLLPPSAAAAAAEAPTAQDALEKRVAAATPAASASITDGPLNRNSSACHNLDGSSLGMPLALSLESSPREAWYQQGQQQQQEQLLLQRLLLRCSPWQAAPGDAPAANSLVLRRTVVAADANYVLDCMKIDVALQLLRPTSSGSKSSSSSNDSSNSSGSSSSSKTACCGDGSRPFRRIALLLRDASSNCNGRVAAAVSELESLLAALRGWEVCELLLPLETGPLARGLSTEAGTALLAFLQGEAAGYTQRDAQP
ncbi:uncharacterized protein LOC113146810 [Cyclospora cayetanensis]|uniref:Uncharacterized protein LOC113146810 n=1 Tax=Cyclospora cayetanensis TaxID=88456 RepID=A0A6P6RT83_9EIME|nr:uncharacterized protein LOC113146810 [Cyclospora cayetanensis]